MIFRLCAGFEASSVKLFALYGVSKIHLSTAENENLYYFFPHLSVKNVASPTQASVKALKLV